MDLVPWKSRKKVRSWSCRSIFKGVRLILVKLTLEVIPLYWNSLGYILKWMLEIITNKYVTFLMDRKDHKGSLQNVVLSYPCTLGNISTDHRIRYGIWICPKILNMDRRFHKLCHIPSVVKMKKVLNLP